MSVPLHVTVEVVKFLAKHERFTRQELIVGTGISRAAIERLVIALRKAKAIHVDEWLDDSLGRQSIAVFTLGEGRDARKRTRLSGRAKTAAYKDRQKLIKVQALTSVLTNWRSNDSCGQSDDRDPQRVLLDREEARQESLG